ncbi:hypothetical protein ACQJBY_026943 [Aegilops geniculata]
MEPTSSLGADERRGPGSVEVQVAAAALQRSEVFHVVKELLGFVLYMHHQIPSVLQSLETEFAGLKEEMSEMTAPLAELKPSDQRKYNTRKREVRCRIKKQEKLMKGISTVLTAFQQALDKVSTIEGVALILGGSLAVRALISCGAGSLSYTGPTKLFLLVRCPCTLNLPLDFAPKREFRYSKKQVVPQQMSIKCNTAYYQKNNKHAASIVDPSCCTSESSPSDVIWFQCKHTIRGLPCKASLEG